jgi:hypothetical protein
VNKKKQKNFDNLGHGHRRGQCPWPGIEEVFAPLFSKSGCFAFLCDALLTVGCGVL